MLESELKAFYMVAQLGSVTLAAKKLGLSQPTVTNQIRQLESQFAVELFYRGGRRLTLSETGTRLLPLIKPMLSHSLNIEFFLNNASGNAGKLRIGATAPYYILDLVKAFREQHGGQVSLELGNSQQMIEALDEYRVDVVTSSQRLTDSRLFCLPLGQDPLVLVVHRSHPLANQSRIQLSALEGHCVLMREHGSHTRQLTEDMLVRAQLKLENIIEIGSREAIREAVLRNIGVSIIARHEVPDSQELRIVTIHQATLLDEFLYCLKERRGARLISEFVQVAQRRFG
ncbi:LysR substrate-binding domain-containing protein [Pseudomonas turukhanskensis]|uniref:Transcriptional regulator n=1 Tax=Pseudomonas turukhanskensis TaxID=1806536 RepID=A0A9W6KCL4_9PSED|nr:LysR substrate-binding domain-containing protein [Pseudomonas turukhanskensis]GLK91043.1 transcriptional regulator [Pseudomonas turukhanskensis]